MSFSIIKNSVPSMLILDQNAYVGVVRIADTVAEDICLVCNTKPEVSAVQNGGKIVSNAERAIIVGTLSNEKESILSALEAEERIDLSEIRDKDEVFMLCEVYEPFGSACPIKDALVIAGSDKRGTIYGLFRVSELCGVSPLVYWGDVVPAHKDDVSVDFADAFVSKIPSVKYRGFFINDEWPAFGRWSKEKFGDVNAKCYDEVFKLLLRLKGNYIWPAMWNSAFSEDGPGIEAAELADKYGVIMGASHHEPMCRAGIEWQNVWKNYGTSNEWSFISNRDAITEFWKDGIERNKNFENIITIGMRGENDSKLMGENATLADNIAVIKDAITTQNNLIKECFGKDAAAVPRMLAIYKEVEDYYYGDECTEGLKNWSELKDVILMLCEDNFGNMRGLPSKDDPYHPGGYGMYYHFDYHGAPISYEWANVTRLTKTWEQMTTAYEYGVNELWIVNVGDLKGNEFPLYYFMELAYDYETWSTPNATGDFIGKAVDSFFGNRLDRQIKLKICDFIDGFTELNALRRPETLNPRIYHSVNYKEAERIYMKTYNLYKTGEWIRDNMSEECFSAFGSMFYYPGMISLNNIFMNIEAGWNEYYASKGCISANSYIMPMKKHIADDGKLVEEFNHFLGGKWNHMMDSAHTNFRSWDDYDWTYPVINEVVPIPRAKAVCSFADSENVFMGDHWQYTAPLTCDSFVRPDVTTVSFYIDLRGNVELSYKVNILNPFIVCSSKQGRVTLDNFGREELRFGINRSLVQGRTKGNVEIELNFDNGDKSTCRLEFPADNFEIDPVSRVYKEQQGYICIEAAHFYTKNQVKLNDFDKAEFISIRALGRTCSAIKAFPVDHDFSYDSTVPFAEYHFVAEADGEYIFEPVFMARNPVVKGEEMYTAYSINNEPSVKLMILDKSYYTEWRNEAWNKGVMTSVRSVKTKVNLNKGLNILRIYAYSPNVVVEKLLLYPAKTRLKPSYLGPRESLSIVEE